jgi:hypothetical protein
MISTIGSRPNKSCLKWAAAFDSDVVLKAFDANVDLLSAPNPHQK